MKFLAQNIDLTIWVLTRTEASTLGIFSKRITILFVSHELCSNYLFLVIFIDCKHDVLYLWGKQ